MVTKLSSADFWCDTEDSCRRHEGEISSCDHRQVCDKDRLRAILQDLKEWIVENQQQEITPMEITHQIEERFGVLLGTEKPR